MPITQKERKHTVDGLINGIGLISGCAYIRVGLYPGALISEIIFSLKKGWAYIRGGLISDDGGLKNGGLYGIQNTLSFRCYSFHGRYFSLSSSTVCFTSNAKAVTGEDHLGTCSTSELFNKRTLISERT